MEELKDSFVLFFEERVKKNVGVGRRRPNLVDPEMNIQKKCLISHEFLFTKIKISPKKGFLMEIDGHEI